MEQENKSIYDMTQDENFKIRMIAATDGASFQKTAEALGWYFGLRRQRKIIVEKRDK